MIIQLVTTSICLYFSGYTDALTEHNLLKNLFKDYDIYVRPVRDPSEAVVVSIGLAMQQIIELVSLGWQWYHIPAINLAITGVWEPNWVQYTCNHRVVVISSTYQKYSNIIDAGTHENSTNQF